MLEIGRDDARSGGSKGPGDNPDVREFRHLVVATHAVFRIRIGRVEGFRIHNMIRERHRLVSGLLSSDTEGDQMFGRLECS